MFARKSGRVTGIAALVAATALLSACSSPSPGGTSSSTASAVPKHITIGFSPLNQTDPSLIGLAKGVEGYAASLGDKVLVANPANSAATQVQQIKTWIQNGQVQAIWFLAVSQPAMKQILTLAQSKHVAIVANGSAANYGYSGPQPGVSFSTIDYTIFGGALGKAAGACSTARLGGKAKMIFVSPQVGNGGAAEEKRAFLSSFQAADPGLTTAATVQADGTRLTAQHITASALQAHPDANTLVAFDDESTLGGMSAMKAAGKDLSKICVLGGGGGATALTQVKAGNIYGVAALQFTADLTDTVNILATMSKNPTKVGVAHTTPVKVITQ
jgi:ABC-type sugar transport system substrate-binding protein